MLLVLGSSAAAYAQSSKHPDTAEDTLQHYINLRLGWADWKEYSQFITWPDEPGWDCWRVAKEFFVGQSSKRSTRVVIQVDAPVPDYPYVGWQHLRDWLARIASDERESAERQEAAHNAAREIANAAIVPDCPKGDIAKAGHPVWFPEYNSLAMGISTLSVSYSVDEPVVVGVWAENRSNDMRYGSTCSMFSAWRVDVFDSDHRPIQSRLEKLQEQERKDGRGVLGSVCSSNVSVPIPPHQCVLVKVLPLNEQQGLPTYWQFDLRPGRYTVTEKGNDSAQPGLTITISGK